MSRGGGEMEERLLNASETEQRRESLYLRKKIWSEVRKMWRIALPSTLFRVMSFGCIVVAQAFIGHSSETGLAAYALIQSTFIRFIYGVMAGMSSATETLCGQAYGAQQYHMMGIYLQRSWMVDTFTATLFVPFIIFAGPILRLLGQNIEITKTVDEIYPWVIPYLYSIVFTMTMQMYLQAQMKNAIIGVLSTVALVVDIVATWWCVSVMGMGIHGALLGLNISSWTVVIAEFVYVFGGWCPHTWTGFSTAAFVDLFPMLKLSISSGFMLCLEYWYMSIIVLMSGYTEDANIAISAFSICQYIYTWEMNISLGLLGAACVRVANELGKGDADAVRFSIKVVLVVSAVIGVLCSVLCLAFGGQISYLFSDSHQVSDAVADLSIVLSLSILLNIVQPILSDVIGEVLDFGGLDIVQCARKEVTKMEFTLRDINDNRLQCCIAGKIAEIMTQENKQPNNGDICLIRYAKLKNYKGELQVSNAFDSSLVLQNPDIKEAQALKNMFHVDGNSLDMYQPKHDNVMIQEKRQKWSQFPFKTIQEMKRTDKDGNLRVVCTVYAIDTINGWYYIACAVCSNKVFKQAIIFDEVDVPSWWCEFCQSNVTKE